MDKNFSVLKFLSQVFIIYGITTGLLNILCILFGTSAYGLSTIFSLGNSGVSVATSLQFLFAVSIIVGLRSILMTDILIKKMPLAARIITMFVCAFATIIIFIFLFDWFPADLPLAWIMFIVCFIVSCTVGTLLSVLAEKQENRKLEKALKRYKEEE
ncbi:MAG: DUF3021 family protein [Oscillospiraceae bacterium]|nr:DUF3021 family protein [Oscillospiraceae bacterium]